eukprot:SAG31_NODE_1225_length_9271_cov_10.376472_9_plen_102_part_00
MTVRVYVYSRRRYAALDLRVRPYHPTPHGYLHRYARHWQATLVTSTCLVLTGPRARCSCRWPTRPNLHRFAPALLTVELELDTFGHLRREAPKHTYRNSAG